MTTYLGPQHGRKYPIASPPFSESFLPFLFFSIVLMVELVVVLVSVFLELVLGHVVVVLAPLVLAPVVKGSLGPSMVILVLK